MDFPEFAEELESVVDRAHAAGVAMMLTICTHLTRFARVLAIAERFDAVYCSVGVHPHEAAREPATTVDHLVRLADHPKVIGFGETGLDYFYEHSPRADQQRSFRVHIAAARRAGLPLIVHTRDADTDTARILDEEFALGPFTGLLHCFSSTRALAERATALGLFISFSGIVTFPKAQDLRDVARTMPLEHMLVETDAPFLAPVPKRGKRNEPAFVAHTASELARLRSQPVATVAEATTNNFFRLFTKAERPACA
jgi:TatD DNase family protein